VLVWRESNDISDSHCRLLPLTKLNSRLLQLYTLLTKMLSIGVARLQRLGKALGTEVPVGVWGEALTN